MDKKQSKNRNGKVLKVVKVHLVFEDGYTMSFMSTPFTYRSYIERITKNRPAKNVVVSIHKKLPQKEKLYESY